MGTTIRRAAALVLVSLTASAAVTRTATETAHRSGSVLVARPGEAAPLALTECVQRALAANDAVRAERLRRRELDGQMRQALSSGLPTLDATGVWNRGRDPSFALDSTFGSGGGDEVGGPPTFLDTLLAGFDFIPAADEIPAQTYLRTSLDLNWTVNPLRVLAVVGAAGEAIRSQELAITGAIHRAEQDVVTAYHGIVLAAEQVAAVQARLTNQNEFLDIMRLSLDLDLVTTLDTLQAAVSVANLEPQLRLAQRGLRTAGAGLNVTMGVDPKAPVAIYKQQSVELDPLMHETALALAEKRTEVQQLDAVGQVLRQSRRAQKADLWPFLALNGSYGLVGKKVSGLNNSGHDFWSASVVLNVPLFDGLLTRGQMQETDAAILRTQSERDGLLRQVRMEVLDLLDGLAVARDNLRAAQLNMSRADELLETSTLMLQHGRVEYLTVLESEAGRAQARSHLIQARYDVLTTTASLKRAIGVSPMLSLAAIPGLTMGDAE